MLCQVAVRDRKLQSGRQGFGVAVRSPRPLPSDAGPCSASRPHGRGRRHPGHGGHFLFRGAARAVRDGHRVGWGGRRRRACSGRRLVALARHRRVDARRRPAGVLPGSRRAGRGARVGPLLALLLGARRRRLAGHRAAARLGRQRRRQHARALPPAAGDRRPDGQAVRARRAGLRLGVAVRPAAPARRRRGRGPGDARRAREHAVRAAAVRGGGVGGGRRERAAGPPGRGSEQCGAGGACGDHVRGVGGVGARGGVGGAVQEGQVRLALVHPLCRPRPHSARPCPRRRLRRPLGPHPVQHSPRRPRPRLRPPLPPAGRPGVVHPRSAHRHGRTQAAAQHAAPLNRAAGASDRRADAGPRVPPLRLHLPAARGHLLPRAVHRRVVGARVARRRRGVGARGRRRAAQGEQEGGAGGGGGWPRRGCQGAPSQGGWRCRVGGGDEGGFGGRRGVGGRGVVRGGRVVRGHRVHRGRAGKVRRSAYIPDAAK